MTGLPAARLGDAIAHTESAFGFGLGGEIGLGVGLALLTVATGGSDLLVLGAVGGAVALTGGGALMGMNIGSTYGDATGQVTTGSPTVLTNGRPAARAVADVAVCDEHNLPQQIATGSTTVFINGMPAARLGDHTVCDARISTASNNVVIGGGTGTYAAISGEVPAIAVTIARDMAIGGTAVALAAGGGAAFAAAGWAGLGVFGLQAGGGLAGGALGALGGGALGSAIDPVHGGAWGQAIGGFGGGLGGGAAAGRLGSALTSSTTIPGEQILQTRPSNDVNAEMAAAKQDPAWTPSSVVTTKTVPENTTFNMTVSKGQAEALEQGAPAFGQWATKDPITSQDYARNNLAIQPQYKDDVSYVAQVRTTAPQTINTGGVGPQGSLPGGGTQVQFDGGKNLELVGSPQPVPVSAPLWAPPPSSTALGSVAGSGILNPQNGP